MPQGKSEYKLCEKCSIEISLFGFNKHTKACDGSPIKRWDKNRNPESRRKYTLIEQQCNIKIHVFFLHEIEKCENDYKSLYTIMAHYANSKQDPS